MTVVTLQDLERYATKRAVQATLRRVKISEEGTYDEFVGQLYDDIDQLIYRMQSGPELRQNDAGSHRFALAMLRPDWVNVKAVRGHLNVPWWR